jgi:uncharacterized damage-inducible protein DinB
MPSPEYWLRGPIPDVPQLLQPVAHALLQARDEINEFLIDFPNELLWEKPGGSASVAFHLQHIPGVLDRLFTYAGNKQLDQQQLDYMAAEGKEDAGITVVSLLQQLHAQVEKSISILKTIDPATLTDHRGVGRKQIPSTVIGLLFHSAEHTMRHTGQLLVTVSVLRHV